ncbi:MAG: hypothetical protein ABI873_09670, partial [Marmoricola sp.]
MSVTAVSGLTGVVFSRCLTKRRFAVTYDAIAQSLGGWLLLRVGHVLSKPSIGTARSVWQQASAHPASVEVPASTSWLLGSGGQQLSPFQAS